MRNVFFVLLFSFFALMSSISLGAATVSEGIISAYYYRSGSGIPPTYYRDSGMGLGVLNFVHEGVRYRVGFDDSVFPSPVQGMSGNALEILMPISLSFSGISHSLDNGSSWTSGFPAGVTGEFSSAEYTHYVRNGSGNNETFNFYYNVIFSITSNSGCGDANCEACCRHKCTGSNPNAHPACSGTPGPGGCWCHPYTCGACCIHKCTGESGDPEAICVHDSCDGTSGLYGCSCHQVIQCYCGACCKCKCVCGHWPSYNSCFGTCHHACPGVPPCIHQSGELSWSHCECHHEDDDDDNEGGGCCEHCAKQLAELEKIRGIMEKDFEPPADIGGGQIADVGVLQNPGQFSDPGGISSGVSVRPPPPSLSGLDFEGPSTDGDKPALRFFERPGLGELPEFGYEKIFGELEDGLGDKIPLGKLDGLKEASSGSWDWKWKVDFSWYGQRYGPWEFDVKQYIDEWAQSDLGRGLRLLFLFYIGTVFMFSVASLIFDVA